MTANMLKLNQEETELIIFAPKHQVKHFSDFRLKFDGTVLSDAKIQYSFGPKTEPCGTPNRSLISSDCTDPVATL
jgi:hypothetical protein